MFDDHSLFLNMYFEPDCLMRTYMVRSKVLCRHYYQVHVVMIILLLTLPKQ